MWKASQATGPIGARGYACRVRPIICFRPKSQQLNALVCITISQVNRAACSCMRNSVQRLTRGLKSTERCTVEMYMRYQYPMTTCLSINKYLNSEKYVPQPWSALCLVKQNNTYLLTSSTSLHHPAWLKNKKAKPGLCSYCQNPQTFHHKPS
ncbi:hypothetical protein LZ30DRAFT_236198 [Colletotrichum cereale]|nr:hypothetical protein LZ30DRAFT_236198 [Colletotrichum cereale]